MKPPSQSFPKVIKRSSFALQNCWKYPFFSTFCSNTLFKKGFPTSSQFLPSFLNSTIFGMCTIFYNRFSQSWSSLTHYSPVLLFYTPWKHQKTFKFSDVFRGYRIATPGCNRLRRLFIWKFIFCDQLK